MGTIYRAQGLLSEPSGVRRDRFTPVTSDRFTGIVAAVGGRLTDSGDGGVPMAWEGVGTGVMAGGGTLYRSGGTGVWGAAIDVPVADLRVEVGIEELPSNGFMIDLRRKALSGTPDGYRCNVAADGSVALLKRVGGSTSTLDSAPSVLQPGGVVSVQARVGELAVFVDGTAVCRAVDSSIAGSGLVGLAGSGDTTFSVSRIRVDAID